VPSTLDDSTFLGGTGTDEAYAVAADAAGNTYVTGMTSSANFPGVAGGFDPSLGGIRDAFVAKFRPDGTLAWASFLGGSGDERGHGIALDAAGNVYVTGRTDSADFPTTAGSFDTTFNGEVDAFVTKLTTHGALVYSTFLGGTGFEIDQGFDIFSRRVGAVAVDAAGNAYVTGSTTSADFPTTAGAFQTANRGFFNAYVTKLNAAGSALVYSTYLGGSGGERGTGIAVDAAGNAYVGGEAHSMDFPTTAGAFRTTLPGGGSDLFVTKLNAAGSGLVYSTYLGGSGSEDPGRLALDAAGNAHVTGSTASFDFPVTPGAFQPEKAQNWDAFVTKLNAAGSALVYSTHLGGDFGNDHGHGIAVDAGGRAYVSGRTFSATFPVADAFQPTRRGVSDAFVTSLNPSGTALVYSSYLGGGNGGSLSREDGYGVAVDARGTAHVVGQTPAAGDSAGRPPFPTTPDAFQPVYGGGATDAFVARVTGASGPETPALTVSDVAVSEGDAGAVNAVFTVRLSAATSLPVTVTWFTSNGIAVAGADYLGVPETTLTFAPGETSKTITVQVLGDTVDEPDEWFFVNFHNATNAVISDPQGEATIVDDDPTVPFLYITDVARFEGRSGTTRFVFAVELSVPSSETVTVAFATADGSATLADGDYLARSGIVSFAPGQTRRTITVLVRGDRRVEPTESFFVNLGNATNATLADFQGRGTVLNDDGGSAPPAGSPGTVAGLLPLPESSALWPGDVDDGSPWQQENGRRTIRGSELPPAESVSRGASVGAADGGRFARSAGHIARRRS
jgi:hypothetical protein